MTKKTTKRLTLDRITVLRLGEADLRNVGGYSPTAGDSATCTYTVLSDYCTKALAGCSIGCSVRNEQ